MSQLTHQQKRAPQASVSTAFVSVAIQNVVATDLLRKLSPTRSGHAGRSRPWVPSRVQSRAPPRGISGGRASMLTIFLAAAVGLAAPACDEAEPAVVGQNVDAAVARRRARSGLGQRGRRGRGRRGAGDHLSLTILHTNDLHSHLWGHSPEADYTPATLDDDPTLGGFARLAAAIKAERASAGADVLLLDGGDFLMGTLFHLAGTSKAPELKLMQALGYDAAAIGNHEFDFTPAGLAAGGRGRPHRGGDLPAAGHQHEVQRHRARGRRAGGPAGTQTGPIRTKLVKTLPGGLKVGHVRPAGRGGGQRFAAAARPVTFDPIATAAGGDGDRAAQHRQGRPGGGAVALRDQRPGAWGRTSGWPWRCRASTSSSAATPTRSSTSRPGWARPSS